MDPQNTELRQLDFCNAFWGPTSAGGVENVLENVKMGSKVLQELARWYQERASIEEEYGKRLAKLARQRLGYAEYGTLKVALDRCRNELAKTAQCHQNLATVMGKELADGIDEFLKRREGLRKGPQAAIEKSHKTRKQQEEAAIKSRRKFEELAMSVNELTAQSSLTQGKEHNKLSVKLDRAKMTADGNQQEYENACKLLKETTTKWNMDWKNFLDLAQDLEESRRDFIKASLWEYANTVSTVCVVDDEACERVRTALEVTYTAVDLHAFVTQKGTGSEIYDPVPFIDFAAGESVPTAQTFRVADHARTSTHPRIRPVPSSIQDLVGAIQTRPNTPGEEIPSAPPSPLVGNTSKMSLGLPGKGERDEQRKRTLDTQDSNSITGSATLVGSLRKGNESTSTLGQNASPATSTGKLPLPDNSSPKTPTIPSPNLKTKENGVDSENGSASGSGTARKFTASAWQNAAPIPADRRPTVTKQSTFVAEPDPLQAALEKLKSTNSSSPTTQSTTTQPTPTQPMSTVNPPTKAGSISSGAGKVPQPRDTLESLLVNLAESGGSPTGTLGFIASPTVMKPTEPLGTTPRGFGSMQGDQDTVANGLNLKRIGTPLAMVTTPPANSKTPPPPLTNSITPGRQPSLGLAGLPGAREEIPSPTGGNSSRPPSRASSPSAVAVPPSHMFSSAPPSAHPQPPNHSQANRPLITQTQSPPQLMNSPSNQFPPPSGFSPYPPNQFNPMQNQFVQNPSAPTPAQSPPASNQPQRQQSFTPGSQPPFGQTPPLQMQMPPHMQPQMMGGPMSPQTQYGFHPMMGMYGGQPGFMQGPGFGFQQIPQQQQSQQQPMQQPTLQQQPSQQQPQQGGTAPPPTGQYTEDGKPILFYVQAIYDYNPQEEQDLQFSAEDVIAVTSTDQTGWWEGVKIGLDQSGSFPSNFVKLLE